MHHTLVMLKARARVMAVAVVMGKADVKLRVKLGWRRVGGILRGTHITRAREGARSSAPQPSPLASSTQVEVRIQLSSHHAPARDEI